MWWSAVSMSLASRPWSWLGPYLFHIAIDWYIVPGRGAFDPARTAVIGLVWTRPRVHGLAPREFRRAIRPGANHAMVGQKTMYDLRKEIFEHLQRLPMSFFDRSPVGRLVTRATTDVDALNELFASGVVAMLNDFVLLFGLAVFLLAWHFFSAWPRFPPCRSWLC